MTPIIGRHPAFAKRGGFTSPHKTTQALYASLRMIRVAANAALERRGLPQQPCNWRDGATIRRPIYDPKTNT